MPKTRPPDRGWMGDPKHGASMGRTSRPSGFDTRACRVALRRVRLDSVGYDRGGAYWGIVQPLYWAFQDTGPGHDADGELLFRVINRETAKAKVF
jgi:hypothetical protein